MGLLEKDPAQRMDVPTARTILRQQLAGPLASKAPPHLMTDPYSVVPAQRPPAAPPQPVVAPARRHRQPSGQIGGRAMLAPDESLTDRLAKLRQGDGGRRRGNDDTAAPVDDRATAQVGGQPTGAYRPGGYRPAGTYQPPAPGGDTTSVIPPREQWNGARAAGLHGGGTVHDRVRRAPARRCSTTRFRPSARAGEQAVTTVKGWPRNTQLAAGGALAVVVVLGLVFALSGGGDDPAPPVAQQPTSAAPAAPAAFPTQVYNDRGINVHVPKGWDRKAPRRASRWTTSIRTTPSARSASWSNRPRATPTELPENRREHPEEVGQLPESVPQGRR